MRRNLGVRNVGVIDLISCCIVNIKVCMLIKFWICNLCQERFSINQIVSRDTCTCIYVYISRTKQALRRLDPVGIIYRLARNGTLLWRDRYTVTLY